MINDFRFECGNFIDRKGRNTHIAFGKELRKKSGWCICLVKWIFPLVKLLDRITFDNPNAENGIHASVAGERKNLLFLLFERTSCWEFR